MGSAEGGLAATGAAMWTTLRENFLGGHCHSKSVSLTVSLPEPYANFVVIGAVCESCCHCSSIDASGDVDQGDADAWGGPAHLTSVLMDFDGF